MSRPLGGRGRALTLRVGAVAVLAGAVLVARLPESSVDRVAARAAAPEAVPADPPIDGPTLLLNVAHLRLVALLRAAQPLYRADVLYDAHRTQTAVWRAPALRPPAARSIARPAGACWGWLDLVTRHFGANTATGCAVLGCESRGDPNARNPSGATGLFQILGGPTDPEANVALAASMFANRGWQPWSSSRGCWT